MKDIKRERNMKVYETSNSYRTGWQSSSVYRVVPQIRLQGKWLEQCGFDPGTKIKVECENGKLVILKA